MKSIANLKDSIVRGETTAHATAESSINAAESLNESLNAFLQIDREGALQRADEVDRSGNKDTLPLAGIPIAIKDNICVRGMQASCGSRILGPYHPPYNATAIEGLIKAGAVIIGKTNCDEFAMGSSNENSAFGPVKNPWDLSRVPGGSSGGSAAAVAAGIVPIALGSDTGGSIRQPAALCGVVGFKPTYGRVSRYGLIAFGSSLDQIGPFARSAADAATVLDVIAGSDPCDATSAGVAVGAYLAESSGDVSGLRIGIPSGLLDQGVEPGVRAAFDAGMKALQDAGAQLTPVCLPHASLAIPVYYLVANAEASSNLARYDGVRYGTRPDASTLAEVYYHTRARFGAEAKRRIMIGTFVLSAGYYDAYYRKAQQVRALIRRDYDEVLA